MPHRPTLWDFRRFHARARPRDRFAVAVFCLPPRSTLMLRCATLGAAQNRIARLMRSAVCAPGKNVALDLKLLTATITASGANCCQIPSRIVPARSG